MRTQQQDQTGLRTIVGSVNADGTVAAGTGFTVTKQGTGSFIVRPQGIRAFQSVTVVPGNATYTGAYSAPSAGPGAFQAAFFNSSLAASDQPFTFSVTGLAR